MFCILLEINSLGREVGGVFRIGNTCTPAKRQQQQQEEPDRLWSMGSLRVGHN